MAGNQETKEAALALVVIGVLIAAKMKDGFQLKDIVELFAEINANEEMSQVLKVGFENIAQVPAEIKDLSFMEIFDLAAALIKQVNSAKA
jgi:hypothetical protein